MRSISGYMDKFLSMKNLVKLGALFAVFTCLFLVIVFLPQLDRVSTSNQSAMPLSVSTISDNGAGVAIASLGKANVSKYVTQNKRPATNGVVASLSLCIIIRSHQRLFKLGNFASHFKAFQRACLVLDLPPPYTIL